MATRTVCDKCGKDVSEKHIISLNENQTAELCTPCFELLQAFLKAKPEPKQMPKGLMGAIVKVGGGIATVVESAPAKAVGSALSKAAENYASHQEIPASPIKKKEQPKEA